MTLANLAKKVPTDIDKIKIMTSRRLAGDGTYAQFFVNYSNYDISKEIDTDDKIVSSDEKSGCFGNKLVIRSGSVVMMTDDTEFHL